jgi:polyisoprenoid-binding protein YceI
MKNLKTIAFALFIAAGVTVSAQTKKVDVAKSKITWVGKKLTGSHDGTVNLKDGALVFKGKKLTGGTFTADMTTIAVTDLQPGKGKEGLEKHLKNDDFFSTDKHPTSKLDFKTIQDKGNGIYGITADLTIKGITKPIAFDLTVAANSATTTLSIDRTKYDVTYNSGSFFENLGDKTINDDFTVTVKLVF